MKNAAFFLGKGGVGKTTLSASFALGLARSGKRVLIASLDPAHNLGDVLGRKLSGDPVEVEGGLYALEIDLGAWVERYLEESRSELKETYSYNLTLNLDSFFNIMRYSPGTEEYAVLWAIEHIRCELAPEYDVVVFDTPPTALSLRFLALPTISEVWVAELSRLRERILNKRQIVARVNPDSPIAESCVDKDDDKVYGKLVAIRRRLADLHRLFKDESFVSVVLNPDVLSVSEGIRIREELDRIEVPIRALCLNKKGVSTATWSLDAGLAGIPIYEFDFIPEGIHSRDELAKVADASLAEAFHDGAKEGRQ